MGITYIIGIIGVFVFLSSLRVVKEYERGVIFFLGKMKGVRGPGLIILIPIFEQKKLWIHVRLFQSFPAQ